MSEILTTQQRRFLKAACDALVAAGFEAFFSGGSALSAVHLQHRLSEDIDIFLRDPGARYPQAIQAVEATVAALGAQVRVERGVGGGAFCRFFVDLAGEKLQVDLVGEDQPLFGTRGQWEGVPVDSLLNVAVNKAECIYEGNPDVKHFVDLYFILKRQLVDLHEILARLPQRQYQFEYLLFAERLRTEVERGFDSFPAMTEPLDEQDFRDFLLAVSDRIILEGPDARRD